MLDYSLKIGLVPNVRDVSAFHTRKGMFEPAKGVDNKNNVIKYLRDNFEDDITHFVDLEWLNDLGVLWQNADCDRVCEYLRAQEVDAVFIINCNFGNEEACGTVAKAMGLPTLLWGPQDVLFDADGTRYTDTQCGIFAISKQLRRYNVRFSYIENCHVEDRAFREGFLRFLSVATMVKNFKNLTITQVGTRPLPFKSVMCNELELTEKFGINLNNVNLAAFKDKFDSCISSSRAWLARDLEAIKQRYDTSSVSDDELVRMLALVYVYKDIFHDTGADVMSTECWTAMPQAVGAAPCLAMSILADMGYIVVCESDIHGAITSALLMCASRGRGTPLFGEFTARHPHNKNAELLWHCGPFAYSCKSDGCPAKITAGKPSFRAKDGCYTIARFQGDAGRYYLLGGEFETTDGPFTNGTYMWAQFDNLPALEKKLVNGPYIHHMSEIYGRYNEVLREFCKYTDGLEYDPIE